jgi:hypothetical protein
MARIIQVAAIAVAIVALGSVSNALAEETPLELVINPNAEMGLSGWNSNGFSVVTAGSSPTVPPTRTPLFPGGPEPNQDLFQAQITGATMSQDVSFARFAASSEAGTEPVAVRATLGSAGTDNEGAELLVQPEDANGNPLGPSVQLGPATATDRNDQAKLVECRDLFTAPAGMHSVLVTLVATGPAGNPSTAMAGTISVSDEFVLPTETQTEGQGPHCFVPAPLMAGTSPRLPVQPSIVPATPPTTPKPATRAQKLAKAIEVCDKLRRQRKRTACIKAARARFAPHKHKH